MALQGREGLQVVKGVNKTLNFCEGFLCLTNMTRTPQRRELHLYLI